jgi:hypothetical protein
MPRTGQQPLELKIAKLIGIVVGLLSVVYQLATSLSIAGSSSLGDTSSSTDWHHVVATITATTGAYAAQPLFQTTSDRNTNSADRMDEKTLLGGNNLVAKTKARPINNDDESDTNLNLNLLCPSIPTDNGKWSRRKHNFTWTRQGRLQRPTSNNNESTTTNTAGVFQETITFVSPAKVALPWNTNNRTVVFYGSSHLRELYFSFVRLTRGLHFNVGLESNVTNVGSGFPDTHGNRALCDPDRTGYIQGAYGVDLVNCGAPTIRLVPELDPHKNSVAIGFKTFVHTPDADQRFLTVLESYGLRHPDILLVDVGIWGLRGDKRGGSSNITYTPEQEVDYYLTWILDKFESSRVVWIYETSEHDQHLSRLILSRLEQIVANQTITSKHVLLRKDWLMENKPNRMPCRHGCSGPLMGIMALLIRDWLLRPVSECFY